ncbi:transcriptional repressor LexA [Lactobacillus sp. LL6]|uniref:transcriptional repressor LexA n=1 Tax=Lactobacillus sp. LL6 TaxID=2596827 RepID=UPI0011851150|nr:transcriptional repressor LexA [Lactobacillus sp. LL6]TSO26480.1 transcriptional repressor LexA [Lactobacillus sp. LL6]
MLKNDKKQLEVLRYIYESVEQHGFPPTVREICSAVGLSSTSTVHGHIARLQRKGYVIKDATKPRAIEVTDAGRKAMGIAAKKIPVLGVVTAGQPILAVEENEPEDYFPLPPDLEGFKGDLYMLTIKGSSMINSGIFNGDQVIVRKQNTAENGDIVVAMTDENEATVKRFYKEKDHYRLQPENDAMSPIILTNVTILGKVIGLYRNHIS